MGTKQKQSWQVRLRLRLLVSYDTRWNAWVRTFTAWLEKPYLPLPHKVWRMKEAIRYPYVDALGNCTIIGPECFSSEDCSVISWRGENYYIDSIPIVEENEECYAEPN